MAFTIVYCKIPLHYTNQSTKGFKYSAWQLYLIPTSQHTPCAITLYQNDYADSSDYKHSTPYNHWNTRLVPVFESPTFLYSLRSLTKFTKNWIFLFRSGCFQGFEKPGLDLSQQGSDHETRTSKLLVSQEDSLQRLQNQVSTLLSRKLSLYIRLD